MERTQINIWAHWHAKIQHNRIPLDSRFSLSLSRFISFALTKSSNFQDDRTGYSTKQQCPFHIYKLPPVSIIPISKHQHFMAIDLFICVCLHETNSVSPQKQHTSRAQYLLKPIILLNYANFMRTGPEIQLPFLLYIVVHIVQCICRILLKSMFLFHLAFYLGDRVLFFFICLRFHLFSKSFLFSIWKKKPRNDKTTHLSK